MAKEEKENLEKVVDQEATNDQNTSQSETADAENEAVEDDTGAEEESTSELEAVKLTLTEKENQIARLSAEIQNMRRRHENERQDMAKYRSQSLAQEILPTIDNLERALAIEVEGEANQNFKKGVEMVHQSLLKALEAEGIEEINPLGEVFDPNFHQSVSSVPKTADQEDEEVVEVYQKGYLLKDRVLRPAMVIIAQ
ncbi:nucleotide exchange factor GrpE [Aerococcus kribbianus]|uniref:Protein GrpE n=1 Tax=Aerococcus kribbianus TaxID=2999064 RepID=A0A9X3JE74_9LACT|nr:MULTISPECIES: nucleotide exchange factor GrpE [unclassified Aerococcus]MCZ0716779.1 nucleotide exchange factor GrpE [Aerococcus sp. YH-aer221]MCZ0725067.1 nucleotide exchange factor GrpE [Aerococcus sp. YH-aer222]